MATEPDSPNPNSEREAAIERFVTLHIERHKETYEKLADE
jgi:hypothetical protein